MSEPANSSSGGLKSGFRWPVAAEQRVAAPAAEVWAFISSPGNLELAHPFCASNPVISWPGPDSRDEVHYLNGMIFERRVVRWIEGIGYDLEVGAREGPPSFVSWRITPGDQQDCSLRITIYPYLLQNWPVPFRWLAYRLRVRPMLERYLQSALRGLAGYVTRGERVEPNQFGAHPWFSR